MPEQKTKDRSLTIRESLFIDLLPANDWIIYKAGLAAGFTETYSRDRLPARVSSNIVLNKAFLAKKAEVQAETGWDAEVSAKELKKRVQYIEKAASGGNIQAVQVQTGIFRELNECAGLHKQINLNLNSDIPTEPAAYKSWLKRELSRLEGSGEVIESYEKSSPAIAKRY